jgi:hypothetical protein
MVKQLKLFKILVKFPFYSYTFYLKILKLNSWKNFDKIYMNGMNQTHNRARIPCKTAVTRIFSNPINTSLIFHRTLKNLFNAEAVVRVRRMK